jgi:hypothetical protein
VRWREGSGWEREDEVKGGDDDGWECRFWVERQSKHTSQTATRTASPSLGKIQRKWKCTRGRCRVQGGMGVVSLGRVASVVRVRCGRCCPNKRTRGTLALSVAHTQMGIYTSHSSDTTTTSSSVITIILYTLYYRFITMSARYSQRTTTVQSPVAIFRAA